MTESEANTILKAEIVHHPECSIFAEALGLAIQALEKQMPKKPKYTHIKLKKRSANLAVSRAFYCVSFKPQLI